MNNTMARQRKISAILLQIAAVLGALLLGLWLWVVIAVSAAYMVQDWYLHPDMAIYLWLMFWVPFHLLAALFLAGRRMFRSRSSTDRIPSSDRFR